ncbi:hypothetical protein SEA_COLT_46 [Mycobacterium phage Colt]|nr:hypothetical protein SEA_COLT_46 [Mycobacterium phage Colt]
MDAAIVALRITYRPPHTQEHPMFVLSLTPTGTVDTQRTEHPNLVEARRALTEFARARGLRLNTNDTGAGVGRGSLSYSPSGTFHQATHTWVIDEKEA